MEPKQQEYFDVDSASLTMAPEQFRLAVSQAFDSGAEVVASPSAFARLYGKQADEAMVAFAKRGGKVVRKRAVNYKDIDDRHHDYLKAGISLEQDLDGLRQPGGDPHEVRQNLNTLTKIGYNTRMSLDTVREMYGERWREAAEKLAARGVNLYERMDFKDAAAMMTPIEPVKAHKAKASGEPDADEMSAHKPFTARSKPLVYVAVNTADAGQGKGTARIYFSSSLAKDREQEWSQLTGKPADVYVLPQELLDGDLKVKVGSAGNARDKWIEIDNRDIPKQSWPWEQGRPRFAVDGRSRKSLEPTGMLLWDTEDGRKNIVEALGSKDVSWFDKSLILSGMPIQFMRAYEYGGQDIANFARKGLEKLPESGPWYNKIQMMQARGTLKAVEKFSGAMAGLAKMFADLGQPEYTRRMADLAAEYGKPAFGAGVPNPFSHFLYKIRERAMDNEDASLWNATTQIAEEDFAPVLKAVNAGVTVKFASAVAGFELLDAIASGVNEGVRTAGLKEWKPEMTEAERAEMAKPYGVEGISGELRHLQLVGAQALSEPAAAIFSMGNYPYRLLSAAGFKEGFSAEAQGIATIVGMHFGMKAAKAAIGNSVDVLRTKWRVRKERLAADELNKLREFAREEFGIENTEGMTEAQIRDLVGRKIKSYERLNIEEALRQTVDEAAQAVRDVEEIKPEEPPAETAAPAQEATVAEEIRNDAGQVRPGGAPAEEGQAKGGPDIQRDQAGERGEVEPQPPPAEDPVVVKPAEETAGAKIPEPEPQKPLEQMTPIEQVKSRAAAEPQPGMVYRDRPTEWRKETLGQLEVEVSNEHNRPLTDLTYDPGKMQFRSNVGSEGITDYLGDVKKYNTIMGRHIEVWKDPETGKTYVINGHHRYKKAVERGETEIAVVEIRGLRNAKEARVAGALINISDDINNIQVADVAKIFRDTFGDEAEMGRLTGLAGKKLTEAAESSGLSMRRKAVREGIKLARLDESIWKDFLNQDLPEEAAVAISDSFPEDPKRQAFLYRLVRERAKRSNGEFPVRYEVQSLANQIVNNPVKVVVETDLLGSEEVIEWESNPQIRADLETGFEAELKNEQKWSRAITAEDMARTMEKLGRDASVLPVEEAAKMKTQSDMMRAVYNIKKTKRGPVYDLITRYTNEIEADQRKTGGKNKPAIVSRFHRDATAALKDIVGGGEGENVGLREAGDVGEVRAEEPAEAVEEPRPRPVNPNQRDLFSMPPPGEQFQRNRPPVFTERRRAPIEPEVEGAPTALETPEIFKLTEILLKSVWPQRAASRMIGFLDKLPHDAAGMFRQRWPRGEQAFSFIKLQKELLQNVGALTKVFAHEFGHFLQFFARERPKVTVEDQSGAIDMLLDSNEVVRRMGGQAPWDDPARYPDAQLDQLTGAIRNYALADDHLFFGDARKFWADYDKNFRKRQVYTDLPPELRATYESLKVDERAEIGNAILRGLGEEYFDLNRMRADNPEAGALWDRMVADQISRVHNVMQSPHYAELKALTQMFNPFVLDADPRYTAYRMSPGELFSDFISATLTNPYLVRRMAPQAFQTFFEWAETQKPEFWDWWMKFSGFTEGDAHKYKQRLLDIRGGYTRSQVAQGLDILKMSHKLARKAVKNTWSFILTETANRDKPMWDKITAQYLRDRTTSKPAIHALAPLEHVLGAKNYLDSYASPYIREAFFKFAKASGDAWLRHGESLKLEELHEFMQLTRLAFEEYWRKVEKKDEEGNPIVDEDGNPVIEAEPVQLAEPRLLLKRAAFETLQAFKEKVGERRYEYYADFFDDWQTTRQKEVIAAIKRSQIWPEDSPFIQKIENNRYYGRFSSLDAMEEANRMYGEHVVAEHVGSGGLNTYLKARKGMTADVADMVFETLNQDVNIMRMARRAELNREFVDEALKYGSDFISVREPRYPDWKKLDVWRDGEKIEYWLDSDFHDAITKPDLVEWAVTQMLEKMNMPFKNMFVKYNLGFSLNNMLRDYLSSSLKLPQARRIVDINWHLINALPDPLRTMLMDATGIHFNRSLAKYIAPALSAAYQEITGAGLSRSFIELLSRRLGVSTAKRLEAKRLKPLPESIYEMEKAGAVSPANSWNVLVGLAELSPHLRKLVKVMRRRGDRHTNEIDQAIQRNAGIEDWPVPESVKQYFRETEGTQRFFDQYNLWLQNDPAKFDREITQPLNQFIVGVAKDIGKLIGSAVDTMPQLAQFSDRINKVVGYEYLRENARHIWPELTAREREAMTYNAIRSRAGSPDFRQRGMAYSLMNNLFLFSQANINGMTSMADAFRDKPLDTAWKMAMYNVGPKVFLYMLAQGAIPFSFNDPISGQKFDQDDLKKMLGKIPQGQLARYRIVPMFAWGPQDELVYLTLPSSFEGEAVGMMAWYGLDALWNNNPKGFFKTLFAQIPLSAVTPPLQAIEDWARYFQGINNIDTYTGRPVTPPAEFRRAEAAQIEGGPLGWLRWAWGSRWIAYDLANSLTNGFVYRASDILEPHEAYQSALTAMKQFVPVLGPTIGRIVRSTNYGEKEKIINKAIQEEEESQAEMQAGRDIIDAYLKDRPRAKGGRAPRITRGDLRRMLNELKGKKTGYQRSSDLADYVRGTVYRQSGVLILQDVANAADVDGIVERLKDQYPRVNRENYKDILNRIEREELGYNVPERATSDLE